MRARVPFAERGGAIRGAIDLAFGRYPRFAFGGPIASDLLPVFHFHDVTVDDLEPKLRYLAENGYRTVSADDIEGFAAGRVRLDGRRVGLCFDDAWASLWTVAAPLLKQYGLMAITYVIPARLSESEGSSFATWPQLAALQSSGLVDIQSHTDSHSMVFCGDEIVDFVTPSYRDTPLLNRPQLTPAPALRFMSGDDLGAPLYVARSRMSAARRVHVPAAAYERCVAHVRSEGGPSFFDRPSWRAKLQELAGRGESTPETGAERQHAIEDELDRSRSILSDRFKTRVDHLCLPWGVSCESTAAAARRIGYRSAIANRWRGVMAVRRGDDRFWLKRLPNRYIFRLPAARRSMSA